MKRSIRKLANVLITGGAGFIGSHFIDVLLDEPSFLGQIVNYDALTYAGHMQNNAAAALKYPNRYNFVRGNIRDASRLHRIFNEFEIDTVVNFAAETHVDRSINNPNAFVDTNVLGTSVLLEVARSHWNDRRDVLFHQISTDEVFGDLINETGKFSENTPFNPSSPYSASKASADHLVSAYGRTYELPYTISHCSNNYGPRQFPEKLIPFMIDNIVQTKPLPVYGDGLQIRDWLYVEDHAKALVSILQGSEPGETYCIGGDCEVRNLDLLGLLCSIVAGHIGIEVETVRESIIFITDRKGHDRRYAIDSGKIKNYIGWQPEISIQNGLEKTVTWYLSNDEWMNSIRTGEYIKWISEHYGDDAIL